MNILQRRVVPFCRRCGLCCALACALCCALGWPADALAHRANLFAWVEGDAVLVECAFRKNQPVRAGRLTVLAGRDGTVLLEGRTDDAGRFRFPVPAAAAVQGLTLRLKAGEGHENHWTMAPDEFAAAPAAPPVPVPTATAPAPVTPAAPLTATDVERLVNAALSAQLAPMKRQLAALSSGEPTLRDVVGGIGWILGLAGAAALCRRRVS